jgi:hypothetical protein
MPDIVRERPIGHRRGGEKRQYTGNDAVAAHPIPPD